MSLKRGYIVVEGHGELEAAHNLVARLAIDLGCELAWTKPLRFTQLHLERGVSRAAERVRIQPDVGALLILRDEDDRCPAHTGPALGALLRALHLPFPAAAVLLYREFEALFLPCIDLMAGKELRAYGVTRPGLLPGARFDGDPEAVRGVKEWLTRHLPRGSSYKPTLDQLPFTRMLDFERLRASGLPCFGSLERALRFLGDNLDNPGAVYPPTS